MTVKQAADVLKKKEHVIRQFAIRAKVATRQAELGDGRQKYYLLPDFISKLREAGFTTDAERLERWHRDNPEHAA